MPKNEVHEKRMLLEPGSGSVKQSSRPVGAAPEQDSDSASKSDTNKIIDAVDLPIKVSEKNIVFAEEKDEEESRRIELLMIEKQQKEEEIIMRNERYIESHKMRMSKADKKRKDKSKNRQLPKVDYVYTPRPKIYNVSKIAQVVKNKNKKMKQAIDSKVQLQSKAEAPIHEGSQNVHVDNVALKENNVDMLVIVHNEDDEDEKYDSHTDLKYTTPMRQPALSPEINTMKKLSEDLIHAKSRNEAIFKKLSKQENDECENLEITEDLENQAYDNINTTVVTAMNACEYTLMTSQIPRLPSRGTEHLGRPPLPFRKPTPYVPTREDILVAEKLEMLRQWKLLEYRKSKEKEVRDIEKEVQDMQTLRKNREIVEDFEKSLRKKKMQQIKLLETLKQQEIDRLQREADSKHIYDQKLLQEKTYLEQKLANKKIFRFIKAQEERLQEMKNNQERRMEANHYYQPSPNMVAINERESASNSNSDTDSQDSRESKHKHKYPRGLIAKAKMETKGTAAKHKHKRRGHVKPDFVTNGLFDYDKDQDRQEKKEFYRARLAEKERQKELELQEIQERLNPNGARRKNQNLVPQKKNLLIKKLVKPAQSSKYLSEQLSRNRKVC